MGKIDIEKLMAQAQLASLGKAIINLMNEQMGYIIDPIKDRIEKKEYLDKKEKKRLKRKLYDYTAIFCTSGDEKGRSAIIQARNYLIEKLDPDPPWFPVDFAIKRAEKVFEIALGFAISRNSFSWMQDLHIHLANQLKSSVGQRSPLTVEDIKELPDKSDESA